MVEPGSRNYMGVDNAAINALVDGLVLAESQEDFVATVRALDRVLMAGRYVIPIWPAPALQSRVAISVSCIILLSYRYTVIGLGLCPMFGGMNNG